ncbi:copper-binding protein [Roseibium alexandrii]|uniref:Periplasmic copper-binding protein n=1 Tax=Roseibium alexandrii TaxID=388408 RepID=A0A0M7A7H5_9HYPH|nr:copper-binding protein [Roseibium alexandrii]CTQ69683.1 periplasmic copper-binding protein [Roseibium alexandrii]
MKLIKTLIIAAFLAAGTAPMTFADSKHGSDHSGMDHSNMDMNAEQMEGAVHTQAVVNSIGDGTANVTHEPIPEIGWPAMTMDLPLMESAQMMGDVDAGDSVTLMLVKGDDGLYAIGAMMPN